jgi:hypothetical protein
MVRSMSTVCKDIGDKYVIEMSQERTMPSYRKECGVLNRIQNEKLERDMIKLLEVITYEGILNTKR